MYSGADEQMHRSFASLKMTNCVYAAKNKIAQQQNSRLRRVRVAEITFQRKVFAEAV